MTLGKSQSLQGSSKDPDAIKVVLPDAQAHLSGQCAYPPLYKRSTGIWRVHNFFVIHQRESGHVCDFFQFSA
jgi:hypothetical protein